ncbi:uncharacterized membrane protein YhaH (DUF805 family) [Gibbsiella quercinecans]|uniref:DUF805 domain-containing protein n=1 Tax=Gibbsiella quercinecans TaxID=929813 RepID=A0A250B1B0_9GAMM|nr:DUF805 domain-containing protein [Gibbsiella quercinecans]ATA20018.1 hypothetical protein AWC35_12110 [Gibbsiella quercinecans]RLM05095.1 hypothetical protein BIY30_19320 [Gibbsiella quercinecans]RLM05182.1 hypothetical protein BIY31_17800 [Gibbsiella quercinecans]TCT82636.1 uncharacterized membrane protein YhaH (DUF805 family) [Gibbsiella quercinecans]
MSLQQWCFSFKGRIGRRDFWIWIAIWCVLMALAFTLANYSLVAIQSVAFFIVALLWPTAAVLVKRLHDRGKAGGWALLLILAWVLAAGNWHMLAPLWQWGVGRFIPAVIFVMMLVDLGAFVGTPGNNRFGPEAEPVRFR